MSKKIMVTGGTGYIGNWVVKGLLEKGYTVRLTARDKSKISKFQHLQEIEKDSPGTLEIWEADLLKKGSYDESAQGVDAIIHMASPFTMNYKDPQKELIEPALKGTKNVLHAASQSETVKKVVLTSSVVAVNGDAIDMKKSKLSKLTEAQYNFSSSATHQPYAYSKVTAEKEAWKMAKAQNQWDLVVVNPGFVMGPSLTKTSNSGSLQFMKNLLRGKMSLGVPALWYGFVDVRDVATGHILALEKDDAEGRHILVERTASFLDFAKIIRKVSTQPYKLPKKEASKLMLYLTGWAFGLTPKFISRNVGHRTHWDNSKSIEKLGLKYTPLEVTAKDMVEQMEAQGIVSLNYQKDKSRA